jgi:general stress protein 26
MNTTNLNAQTGIKKLQDLVEEIETCLFCTDLKTGDGSTCRPMQAAEVDEKGDLWFFSDINSEKNKQIEANREVRLFFSHPGKSSYLVINGEAEIVISPIKTEDLWSPLAKVWFKEGKDDPNISFIKVNVKNAYYWDTDGNKMINFIKLLVSAATGKILVHSQEGSIEV